MRPASRVHLENRVKLAALPVQQQTQQFPRTLRTTSDPNLGYSASPLAAHSPTFRIPRKFNDRPSRTVLTLIVLNAAAGMMFAGSPIVFEENRGQASREVLFLSRGAGYGVFLTSTTTLIATKDAKVVRASNAGWQGGRRRHIGSERDVRHGC